ncbi:hypothetical protein VK792_08865 [Mesobacterium sp. TK19101]|uniref:TFIIB-type zinc ribbon-containing protein n=1 Tax=Mesobacterium hydrothermale TaxID=3111907 RepID=A0ABU6HG07_9RHOB|nr:hypothetical protein [Mesobacterium sp. TK19101]MEC3861393.1 hypothetical protein [Mesobacterium sp. TK19101]
MHRNTKIATCCYCGTRAALVLTADRHELSCSSCGAPLHDLKRLKSAPAGQTGAAQMAHQGTRKKKKDGKPRKRQSFGQRFLKEAFDVIDDIFD